MAWGWGEPAPKPKRKITTATKRRRERKVIDRIRAFVEDRDGPCRIARDYGTQFGPCRGHSQWAHLGDLRRFKTRGKPPEERHTTYGSLMMCDGHHDDYDEHHIDLLVGEHGANGRILVVKR